MNKFEQDFNNLINIHNRVSAEVFRISEQLKILVKNASDTVSIIGESRPHELLDLGFIVNGSALTKETKFDIEKTDLKLVLSEKVSSSYYRVGIKLNKAGPVNLSGQEYAFLTEAILLVCGEVDFNPAHRHDTPHTSAMMLAELLQRDSKMGKLETFIGTGFHIEIIFPLSSM